MIYSNVSSVCVLARILMNVNTRGSCELLKLLHNMNTILYIFRSSIRETQDASEGALSAGDSQDKVEISDPDIVNDLHPLVDEDVLAFIRSNQDLHEVGILDNYNVDVEIGRY